MAKETIIGELGEGDAEQVRTFDVLSGDDVEDGAMTEDDIAD